MISTEREIKILAIDKDTIMQKISDWGCERTMNFLLTDHYRESSDNKYKKQNKKVKLRTCSHLSGCELIVKEKISADLSKVCREETVMLASLGSAERFLSGQGLFSTRIKQKIRSQTSVGSVFFMIDEYAGIPPLLEIEAPSDEILLQWISILGLTEHEQTTVGRKGLCKRYNLDHTA